jgi:N-acetylmuramoyl-L-alanine amidase
MSFARFKLMLILLIIGCLGFTTNGKAAKVAYSLPGLDNFNTSLSISDQNVNDPFPGKSTLKKVILDAGHGGKDVGCVGHNIFEKDIALDITLKLGAMIEESYPDVEVVYTRDKDVFIPLHERALIANRSNADLFISIHCNTAGRKGVKGTETFVMGLHRAADNLEVAKRENASILLEKDYSTYYEGYDPDSNEGHIMLSMYQNAYLDQSIAFANLIETEFEGHGKRVSRGVKQAGFLVLRNTIMPSVLIEAGFLSNNREGNYLKSELGKSTIANAIFNAFSKYKYDVDHKIGEPKNTVAKTTPEIQEKEVVASTSSNIVEETPENVVETANEKKVEKSDGVVTKQKKKVEYVVQLAASPNKLRVGGGKWNRLENVLVRYEKNMYKYQIGELASYVEASDMKVKLKDMGFKDCFVAAYYDGDPINVKDAIRLSK